MACGPLNKSPTWGDLLVPAQSPTWLSRDGSKMSMKDNSWEKTGDGQRRDDVAQEESDRRTGTGAGGSSTEETPPPQPPPLPVCKSLSHRLAGNLCHSPIIFF